MTLIAIVLLAGCTVGGDEPTPTTAPLPTPSPTPLVVATPMVVGTPVATAATVGPSPPGEFAFGTLDPTCIPPVDERGVHTFDQFLVAAGCVAALFPWPDDYVADTTATASGIPDQEISRFQGGYAYTAVTYQNICAWELAWLAAMKRNDPASAETALAYLTTVVPTFSTSVPGIPAHIMDAETIDFQATVHRSAELGDVDCMQRYTDQNCTGIVWRSATPSGTS
jgi:hypothetical protein